MLNLVVRNLTNYLALTTIHDFDKNLKKLTTRK